MLAKPSLPLVWLLSTVCLAQAVTFYLHPPPSLYHGRLTLQDASASLSRHLGLEPFESLSDLSFGYPEEEPFVGLGMNKGLVVTAEDADVQAVLPSLSVTYTISDSVSSLSSLTSTFLHRAGFVYSSIYGQSNSQDYDMEDLVSYFKDREESAFAAVKLTALAELRRNYGASSERYGQEATKIRRFLDNILESNQISLAVVAYTPSDSSYDRRQLGPEQTQSPLPSTSDRPSPQEPIGSLSTCFASVSACNNGTNTCSGRGQCVEASKAGRTCFVCTCRATKTGEGSRVKTETWVGQSCERKDISGPFVLLTGTVIAIIVLVFGSVSLLYGVGDQALPSTLTATAAYTTKAI